MIFFWFCSACLLFHLFFFFFFVDVSHNQRKPVRERKRPQRCSKNCKKIPSGDFFLGKTLCNEVQKKMQKGTEKQFLLTPVIPAVRQISKHACMFERSDNNAQTPNTEKTERVRTMVLSLPAERPAPPSVEEPPDGKNKESNSSCYVQIMQPENRIFGDRSFRLLEKSVKSREGRLTQNIFSQSESSSVCYVP